LRTKERTLPPAVLQDPAFKHSYVKLKDVKLHYVEAGDRSKPLMLFIHGFPEFWFSWRHQLKHFSKDYWVVAYDQRGYGDSEKPSSISSYKVPILVGDVADLVKSLGKEKCVLVGHDWGAVVAWYTASFPTSTSVVDKLIIMNGPHPGAFFKKGSKSWKQFLKSWYVYFFQLPFLPELSMIQDDIAIFERLFKRSDGTKSPTEIIEAYKYTFSKRESWRTPINFYRASLSATSLYNKDVQKMPKIAQPTLIIWGEDDLALEADFPELSAEYCTGTTEIHRIKNGNHFIQTDRPEEVNAAIEKFLS